MASRKQRRQEDEQEPEEDRSKNMAGSKNGIRHQEGAISKWRYWKDGREGNSGSDETSDKLKLPFLDSWSSFPVHPSSLRV